ncbi:hypothetical protein D3C87_1244720 [compost metagenome]
MRVGDVDVGAHMLDAVGGEGLDGFLGPGLGVFLGDGRLAFAPALDAFEQRAAHVPARLAGGQGGVEVDVRFDKGRHHQFTAGIQIVRAQGRGFDLAGDAADQAVFQVQLMQAFLVAQTGIDDVHRADPFGESFRRYPYVSSPATNPASSKCGSEPAREGGVSVTLVLNVPESSRAGSLPQGIGFIQEDFCSGKNRSSAATMASGASS